MNSELNLLNPFGRKVICIILVLLAGIGFSFGSAAANSCEGGVNCPACADLAHGHVPGAAVDMKNPVCPQDGKNSTCGFIFRSWASIDQIHTEILTARQNTSDRIAKAFRTRLCSR